MDLSEDSSIELEAAQWVACRMNGESFDKASFDAWLAGDPRCRVLFDTMWRRIMGPSMDEALNVYGKQPQPRRALLAGGMAIVLAVFSGYKALPLIELFLTEPRDYAAAEGAIREVRLDDGTQLTLAGGADIRVRYTKHGREVELRRGTIFANVARDENRPFNIEAGDGQVTVLGTRFEVSMKPSIVRVTVEAGHVRFGRNRWFSIPIELTADQAASLDDAGLSRDSDVGQDRIARWRHEWIEYREAPMRQVVADLENVSAIPIRISDKKLADQRVSGRIRLTDPARQVDNLAIIHNFTVHKNNNAIILSKN